ncbi:restriction endonuclease subunit S [Idiomarina abyssalis]|uniref:restriction endonuclease subunit S n=1 Tax=Idiomarina abyssalis TaxID=86102 RepID=UPI003A946F30
MSERVPEGWCIAVLRDLALVKGGKRLPKGETFALLKTKFPYIRVSDFKDGTVDTSNLKFVSEEIRDQIKRYVISSNDLYISIAGTLGLVGEIPKELDGALLTENAAKIVFNSTKVCDKSFLKYCLSSDEAKEYFSQAKGTGGGVPKLALFRIEDVSFLFPPFQEQQKIAKILTSVDEVIEKTQSQIDKLKDLKTGMMQELLTTGVGVDGKPHTEFKDSPVGRIPKTWKVVSLSSVAERIGDGIHATPKYVDKSDYPFINGNNLKDGKIFVGSNTRFVSLEEYEKHRTELSDSTILMSINGTIGNLAYYLNEPVVLGKSAAYISLAEGVSKSFIYYVLGSDYVREFYELELTGTTIRNLSLKAIRATPIALPPAVEQDDIARVLSALDENIKLLSSQLSQKMSLKKALMQDLLTGKVRVAID